MRSHVTKMPFSLQENAIEFQYRKRYEVTCDGRTNHMGISDSKFQYRKRYEVTCDLSPPHLISGWFGFQYRKRYEVTCDLQSEVAV